MNLSNELKKYSFLESAKKVAENLNLQVYIVGGFVRDLFLNRNRVDIDFLIVGDGDLFAREFAGELGVNNVVTFKDNGQSKSFNKFIDVNGSYVIIDGDVIYILQNISGVSPTYQISGKVTCDCVFDVLRTPTLPPQSLF